MIKGAFIFAVGASGGLVVGFVSGVLACRSYMQDHRDDHSYAATDVKGTTE